MRNILNFDKDTSIKYNQTMPLYIRVFCETTNIAYICLNQDLKIVESNESYQRLNINSNTFKNQFVLPL